MNQTLSPKQVAAAIGASESSLKRWCDQGLLTVIKTVGGHRRIEVAEVLRFVRERGQAVVEPALLALPDVADRKSRRIEAGSQRLADALLSDNDTAVRALIMDHFVAGQPLTRIFDEVIAPAFHQIGEQWECHEADIYQERTSCQIILRVLHELRTKLPPPNQKRTALGATISGDQYIIPVTMAELVLRAANWDARLLGTSLPFETLINAVSKKAPRLFWLSVSYIAEEGAFISGMNQLAATAKQNGTAFVVGGRALTAEIRKQLAYSAYCDTMLHLVEFANTQTHQRRQRNSE